MTNLEKTRPAGVLTGDDVQRLFALAKERQFALAGANCVGTNSVNAALETAAELKCAGDHPVFNRRGRVLCRQRAEQ